jgi:hypothetical protein
MESRHFAELRGEFICSWCEMPDGDLNAVPHPKPKCKVRGFAYPQEADIVGARHRRYDSTGGDRVVDET